MKSENYLLYLKFLKNYNESYVTASTISYFTKVNSETVKKDLSAISKEKGIPKRGRKVSQVIKEIEEYLGFNDEKSAIVIGVGNIGKMVLNYAKDKYGLNIICAFDNDPKIIGKTYQKKQVFEMDKLINLITELKIKVAILCVNDDSVDMVYQMLKDTNIKYIINYTDTFIMSEDIAVIDFDYDLVYSKLN